MTEIKQKLQEHFDDKGGENDVETIQFMQWEFTDRCNLVTKILPVEEFIDELFEHWRS